jgi:proliferating cell nuclear antigen
MKMVLSDPKLLTDSISVISELVNEVQFKIDKDKIEMIAMDPANVAMIIYHLLSSSFAEYSVDKETAISVSLDSLKAVLKRAKPSDVLVLELDKGKNKLKIQLKGDGTRTFNLALIDIEEREQKVPSLTFPVEIETSSFKLDEAINDMDIVSESVSFTANKDSFVVESESNMRDAKSEMMNDEETNIKFDSAEALRSKYSIEYLKKMIKASKISPKMKIRFSKDYPLRLDYLVKDKVSLSFVLAPRISND